MNTILRPSLFLLARHLGPPHVTLHKALFCEMSRDERQSWDSPKPWGECELCYLVSGHVLVGKFENGTEIINQIATQDRIPHELIHLTHL